MNKRMKDTRGIEYKLHDDDILYFSHLPKTGGMTLKNILDNYFDYDTILPAYVWNELLSITPIDFHKYRFIRGHFGYQLHKSLPKKPVYITMLREPIKRVISAFEYLKYLSSNSTKYAIFQDKSLEEILNDPVQRLRFTNTQTRFTAIDMDDASFDKFCKRISKSEINEIENTLERLYDNNSESELLRLAKAHLLDFAFVGILEKFDESLFLLWYTFGWKPIRNIHRYNETPKHQRKPINKETINQVAECNNLDVELYNFAVKIFESRFSIMVDNLKAMYYESRFDKMPFNEMMLEMLEKHYEKRYSDSMVPISSINYNFTQPLHGSGWWNREVIQKHKVMSRWTGPEKISTIDLLLNRHNDYKIKIMVFGSMGLHVLKSLTLRVNETLINLKYTPLSKGAIFEGDIDNSALSKLITTLSLEVDNTVSPSETHKNSQDTRKLGLRIEQIIINPISKT